MTVETTTNKVTANGNDVATSFSFSPMVIFQSSDLVVVHTDADGVETTLTEGVGTANYAVVVVEYPGTGSITYPASGTGKLATGEKLTMKRVLPLAQTLDLENQGGYLAENQETALDKLLMICLQQQEELDRAVKIPISSTTDPVDYLSEAAASATEASNHKTTASRWASKTDGTIVDAQTSVDSAEFSAKAYAVGGAVEPTAGSAKDWATKTGAEVVSGQGFGAKKYANDAAASATAASSSATDAAQSASQAEAAAASVGFSDVVFVTAVQSPIAITAADSGKLYNCDTSGGAIVFNLPTISALVLPFTLGVKKATGDANTVTINSGGTDTFDDGSASKVLASQYGTTLIPDVDPNPDAWTAADWAGVAIPDGAITNRRLAQMPANTVKANLAGATADAADATVAALFDALAAQRPYFSAYLSATQIIAASTDVKLHIDTVEFDSHGWYDHAVNYRYTPQKAGKYRVTLGVSDASGTATRAIIYKNGAIYTQSFGTGANSVGMTVSKIVSFNGTTDYVEPFAQSNGSAPSIGGGAAPILTWFEAEYLGP